MKKYLAIHYNDGFINKTNKIIIQQPGILNLIKIVVLNEWKVMDLVCNHVWLWQLGTENNLLLIDTFIHGPNAASFKSKLVEKCNCLELCIYIIHGSMYEFSRYHANYNELLECNCCCSNTVIIWLFKIKITFWFDIYRLLNLKRNLDWTLYEFMMRSVKNGL